jgi:DNA-binding transcriptional ArsR family regulator
MREYLLPVPGPDPDYQNVAETLELTGEEADQVFDALSSPTSRSVLRALYDDPLPPADLAEELDTSVQNIHYHLQKLEGANLVEAIETAYSSRGVEMDIYAPTNEALVLLTGRPSRTEQIRSILQRFLGGVAILTIVSLLIHNLANTPEAQHESPPGYLTPTPEQAPGAASNISLTPTPTPMPDPTATPTGTDLAALTAYAPGIFVFTGGLVVLLLTTYWLYRELPEK